MKKENSLSIALVFVTILFVGSSFVTPFAGFSPDAFPIPQDNPPVQPAGYAFAIWGIIYIWLFASALFGVIRRRNDPEWGPARRPLLASLGVGTFWLAVAAQSPVWATVMIWTMWAFAVAALFRSPESDRWWFRAPIALYAGWLTAASSVSIGLLGGGYGLVMGETGWAVFVAALTTVISLFVLYRLRSIPEFAISVAWALCAVAVKSVQDATAIALVAGLCAVFVMISAVLSATRFSSTD